MMASSCDRHTFLVGMMLVFVAQSWIQCANIATPDRETNEINPEKDAADNGGKYENAKDEQPDATAQKIDKEILNLERPFKMNKVNMVWQKARKSLPLEKLAQLHGELSSQDALETEAKKRRADGKDKDGEFEALVRQKMLDIMKKYKLTQQLPGGQDDSRRRSGGESREENETGDGFYKMDKKLKQIWEKAQASGFSQTELDALQEEFKHHQQKVDEFNQLKSETNFLKNNLKDGNDLPDSDDILDKHQRKTILKQKWQDIKDGYDALEQFERKRDTNYEFSEPKVQGLWGIAQQANLTEEELQSIREELRHFEVKIRKYHEFSRQAQQLKQSSDPQKEEQAMKMGQRVDDFARKIKKTHAELKSRLTERIEL